MSSRTFIGGNWKCNCTAEEAKFLTKNLIMKLNETKKSKNGGIPQIVIAPVSLHLSIVNEIVANSELKNCKLAVSAQNCSGTGNGAFTGEISCEQIKDEKIEWVIVGHSERRKLFLEDNKTVAKKINRCIENDLKIIACIGETLEEREANRLKEILSSQLDAIAKVENIKWESIVVAYEPVWAIGTGKVATPKQAQEAHLFIREWVKKNVSEAVGNSLQIIYGGSVKPNNASSIFSENDIDGFLVGGASLKADVFSEIVAATL